MCHRAIEPVSLDPVLRGRRGQGCESPLDFKAIKPVIPKGNQAGIFIGRTDAETEAPVPWPPDAKSQHIGKDSDAGKD